MALAPIILREEAHCQVRWKSNTHTQKKKNCQDSLFVACLPASPVCSLWAKDAGIAWESVMDSPNFHGSPSLYTGKRKKKGTQMVLFVGV